MRNFIKEPGPDEGSRHHMPMFPSEKGPSDGYRPDIDGLRAIAVLMVVLFHAFEKVLPGGFAGVDIFFVISGFLITGIIIRDMRKGVFSVFNFYGRRCRRILPALLVMLAAVWVIARQALLLDEFENFGKHLLSSSFFASNFLLWAEAGYFDIAADGKPLRHLWSLAVEEQFYLLWPLIFWFTARKKLNTKALTLLLILASFTFNLARVNRFPDETFYLLPARFWELLLGCLLAQLHYDGWTPGRGLIQRLLLFVRRDNFCAAALAWLPALLLAAFLLFASSAPFPGWAALLPTLSALIFIWNGPDSSLNKMVSGRFFVFIGRISYPLYLWHWPLFSFAYLKFGRELPLGTGLLIAAISVALAALTWRFVELYAQRSLFVSLTPARRDRRWVLAGSGALLLSGLAGFYTDRGVFSTETQGFKRQLSSYRDYRGQGMKTAFFLGNPKHGHEDFPAGCLDGLGTDKDAVFIWGDSHGERLVYGLSRALAARGIPVYQMGGSACPPIAGLDFGNRPNCRGINDHILGRLAAHRPRVVLLSANWNEHIWRPEALEKLNATIERLRGIGIKRVFVVGQAPFWKKPLYKVLIAGTWNKIPERTFTGLSDVLGVDPALEKAVGGHGAEYVRLMDRLCNAEGCLTLVGGDVARDLTAFDEGHLTDSASEYVAEDPLGPAVLKAFPEQGPRRVPVSSSGL